MPGKSCVATASRDGSISATAVGVMPAFCISSRCTLPMLNAPPYPTTPTLMSLARLYLLIQSPESCSSPGIQPVASESQIPIPLSMRDWQPGFAIRVIHDFTRCIASAMWQTARSPMAISKRIIVQQIIEQLTEQLSTLAGASRAMHADASDEQNKAEDKYDTRGLETAYLASSQARLATETEQAVAAYQNLELRKFGENATIDVTALVELESNGAHTLYFLGPKAGGMEINHRGSEILVITTESPARTATGRKKNRRLLQLLTRGPSQEFRVVSVT